LKEKVRALPAKPGVYIYRDAAGRVIYVGKAKSLKHRVRSYFTGQPGESPKTGRLLREIGDLDFMITANEVEALLLESTLIKKHKPRFNIMLRDDKGYPYLKLTDEEFPRLEFSRRTAGDGARYFGPYSSAAGVRGTLRFLRRVFPIRYCSEMKKKPCMYHHIEKCPGPCSGNVSKEEYAENIRSITLFLEGRANEVVRGLREEMKKASAEMSFEKAAMLRDRVAALESVVNAKQTAVLGDGADRDVVALARDGETACVEIAFVRGGLLTGHDSFLMDIQEDRTDGAVTAAFLKLYYDGSEAAPGEIIVCAMPDEADLIAEFLSSRAGRKVKLHEPRRGVKRKLVETARENARQRLEDEVRRARASREERRRLTTALTNRLRARKLIRRIVGFDISTIQGTNTVGAAVTFQDAAPDKDGYRKFIIKGTGRDDFSSMREMTARYFRRVKDGAEPAPDLVIVDGGLGQVSALAGGLADSGYREPVTAIGYAKKSGVSHVLGESTPIVFSPDEEAARLVQMVIAETHRFAVTFHRKKRGEKMLEE